jgi:hypothetical protein
MSGAYKYKPQYTQNTLGATTMTEEEIKQAQAVTDSVRNGTGELKPLVPTFPRVPGHAISCSCVDCTYAKRQASSPAAPADGSCSICGQQVSHTIHSGTPWTGAHAFVSLVAVPSPAPLGTCNYNPHNLECRKVSEYRLIETDTGKEFGCCAEHIQCYRDFNQRAGYEYFVIIPRHVSVPEAKGDFERLDRGATSANTTLNLEPSEPPVPSSPDRAAELAREPNGAKIKEIIEEHETNYVQKAENVWQWSCVCGQARNLSSRDFCMNMTRSHWADAIAALLRDFTTDQLAEARQVSHHLNDEIAKKNAELDRLCDFTRDNRDGERWLLGEKFTAKINELEAKVREQEREIERLRKELEFVRSKERLVYCVEAMAESNRENFERAETVGRELAALREREKEMRADQIKYMVNRFLGWKLPDNFNPDGGISFNKTFNEHTTHPMKHEPTGTNLLDFTQAEEMVRYLVDGMPVAAAESGTKEPT